MSDKHTSNWVKYMAWGATIATTLAGLVGGGYLLGNYLDQIWDTDPLFKLILMIIGVALGIVYLIASLTKLGKSDDEP